jgi:hypothetical protein
MDLNKTLIAKPVVDKIFWIVTDGKEKVGNVLSNGSGFEVKVNGNISYFENTKSIQTKTHIKFEPSKKPSKLKKDLTFTEFPAPAKVYNSIMDIKRKLHVFTKSTKSKCYYTAGWFAIKQGPEYTAIFCPKYIFVQRYDYRGPYKTKAEAEAVINNK